MSSPVPNTLKKTSKESILIGSGYAETGSQEQTKSEICGNTSSYDLRKNSGSLSKEHDETYRPPVDYNNFLSNCTELDEFHTECERKNSYLNFNKTQVDKRKTEHKDTDTKSKVKPEPHPQEPKAHWVASAVCTVFRVKGTLFLLRCLHTLLGQDSPKVKALTQVLRLKLVQENLWRSLPEVLFAVDLLFELEKLRKTTPESLAIKLYDLLHFYFFDEKSGSCRILEEEKIGFLLRKIQNKLSELSITREVFSVVLLKAFANKLQTIKKFDCADQCYDYVSMGFILFLRLKSFHGKIGEQIELSHFLCLIMKFDDPSPPQHGYDTPQGLFVRLFSLLEDNASQKKFFSVLYEEIYFHDFDISNCFCTRIYLERLGLPPTERTEKEQELREEALKRYDPKRFEAESLKDPLKE